MAQLTCDSELLVHLGREAGHEGLEEHAENEQSVQCDVNNLHATSLSIVNLVEIPGLVSLEVTIAVS